MSCFKNSLKVSRRVSFIRIFLFFIIIAVFVFCIKFGYKITKPVHYIFANEYYSQPCNLPVLDPYDSSILKFSSKPEPLICDDFPSIVFVDHDNVLCVNESATHFFGLRGPSDVLCSIESVYRNGDDDNVGFNLSKSVKLPAKLDSDFNRVTCINQEGKVLFQNIVAGVTPKPHIDQRTLEETDDQLSVLIFGIDSVSRSASIRYFPKTLEVLHKMGFYDFRGHLKNGDNTIPNIIAQLTGLKLWVDNETIGFEKRHFDDFPFLWKNFSSKKYVTLFGEDDPGLAMFNLDLKGFNNPPTDYYMRPFWRAIKVNRHHTNSLYSHSEYHKRIKLTKHPLCNQNTKSHMQLVNYIKQFMLHYKTKRKFVFSFLTELSHDNINFLHHADDDLRDFFLSLKNDGFLERTVVVFFGDHGSRYDLIRNTFVGRMESRMPMLYIFLPDHIKRKFPSVDMALKINTKRLTTHFDIHQTMIDILQTNFRNPSIQIYKGVKRGVSLFQEIPSSRSCVDAHIPATFCACYKTISINVTDNRVIQKLAGDIVAHLNDLLKSEPTCKALNLQRTLSAQKMSQGLNYSYTDTYNNRFSIYRFLEPPEGSRDSYSVIIETVPGNGTFDALVEVGSKGEINSIKSIDRTNAYGNQSSCISNRRLKQYCYC